MLGNWLGLLILFGVSSTACVLTPSVPDCKFMYPNMVEVTILLSTSSLDIECNTLSYQSVNSFKPDLRVDFTITEWSHIQIWINSCSKQSIVLFSLKELWIPLRKHFSTEKRICSYNNFKPFFLPMSLQIKPPFFVII